MLWGAFNNSSSAMQAMSWDMGSISQNIANVNTTGYKRKETLFKTVMSESHAPTSNGAPLNVFGVKTADRYHIAAQGVITPTNFGTDLAINGQGYFLVAPPDSRTNRAPMTASTTDPNAVLYTRDGGFRNAPGANGENYFVTGSGHYLLGWMADPVTGDLATGSRLTPVYTLPTTVMEGRATTEARVIANIPSSAAASPGNFTTTETATDPNTGLDYDLTLNWARVDGTSWTVTPSIDAAVGSVTSGAFTVTADQWGVISDAAGADAIGLTWLSGPLTSTEDVLGAATLTTTPSVRDPLGVNQTITLDWARIGGNVWAVTPTLAAGVGTTTATTMTVAFDSTGKVIEPQNGRINIPIDWDDTTYGTATSSSTPIDLATYGPNISLTKPVPHVEKIFMPVYDDEGVEHTATLALERGTFTTAPPAPPNAGDPPITSVWYLHPSGGGGSAQDTTAPAIELMFDATGKLVYADGAPVSANTAVSMDFEWVSGTTTTSATVAVDLTKLQQYDGQLYIGNVDQNGFKDGTLLRASFNDVGEMRGYFTNGETLTLFKVPIAQFVSENNLDPVSGNLFRRTKEAGELTVSGVEDAVGEPRFIAGAIENSTVDIEDEFTKMIVTQKAYSTNAQVFRTADEMTTVARDLKA